jgi:hypothetical protein
MLDPLRIGTSAIGQALKNARRLQATATTAESRSSCRVLSRQTVLAAW